ncbi:MAG: hypothetical protein JWO38_6508 [Gemmataceae bacterium]|nr:hypothetical protein [Gemmataceae bacterium]
MEALFTNPLTMVAGGALVSAPIIIHLINRMRFRRVKWAAMEFLLKAQKRMKRKLILEQLILLLLRCLLIFLVAVLLARFKWFSPMEGQETRATAHVVVLDDSPSMADVFAADGRQTNAFDQAKTQITEKIAPAAAQANTPQSVDLLLLSDLRQPNDDPATQKAHPTVPKPRTYERLNESAIEDMKTFLGTVPNPSPVRVSLVDGLRTAKEVLDRKPDADVAKVVHIVSDLRAGDWVEDGETLKQLITELTAAGVRIHLVDVAHPYRKDTDRQPRSSDNVGIVEFRPKARTVARFQPVDFELRVKNSGSSELKDVKVQFFLNGRGNIIPTASIPSLPPNQERTTLVTVQQFERVGTKDKPLDRFNIVTAKLADQEPGGIAADNVRHAVVEVQERLSVLVVEGRQDKRDKPGADGFFLKRLFQDAFGGINWVDGTREMLEKHDLRDYACVYLLNVDALTEAQRDKLEAYVRGGGGLGVFLGPNVKPLDYNKVLYRGGEGVFPFLLPESGPATPLTDEQKLKRALVLSKRILTRDPSVKSHPALVGLYTGDRGSAVKDVEVEKFFMFANIDRYWPVRVRKAPGGPTPAGKPDPAQKDWQGDKAVQELYCLPNERPMVDFQGEARDLLDKLKVNIGEPKFEKYRQYTELLDRQIRDTTAGDLPLTVLATLYDRLLCDQINDGDASEPILRELWAQPELTDLRAAFQRARDRVKFGDPLYVVKQFGQGRVAVMTTDAGGKGHADGDWTDWPSGAGAPGWLAIVAEMEKYLSGGATDENRPVGAALRVPLDPTLFQKKNGETRPAGRMFLTADPAKAEKSSGDIPVTRKDLGNQPLPATPGGPVLDFSEAREPGVYLFTLTQFSGPDGENEKPGYAAYAFNLDADREGDLRRANRDDLAQLAPNVPIHSPEDTSWVVALKQKRDDFSTRRWLYLFILLVLVAEQAMAVRLSFHTRPEDLDAHAPSAAAAFARGTTPVVAAAEVEPAEPAGV